MSFGALGGNAVLAMNTGAKKGNFAHDTGEGGISRYHRGGGGDLIWQIGTGYFGCRKPTGGFDPDLFAKNATDPQVKMIEIKVSQGAKPGHGGILPGAKVTEEIAEARLVEVGKTVFSPTYHTAFSTPLEMIAFVTQLRELSGGKPIGFKICIGEPREFMSIVKAMIETGVYADFIVVDGGEGGTGAAPQEFSNSMGFPLLEGLAFVHNTLVGAGIRDQIKVGASGKMVTGIGDRDRPGARRGLVQLRARVHVLGRLHPGPALQHQRLPGRRDHAEPEAPARARRPRQGRARLQLPQEHRPRGRRVRRRDGPRPPEPTGAAPRLQAHQRHAGGEPRRDLSVPEARAVPRRDGPRPPAALLERVDVRAVPVRPQPLRRREPHRYVRQFTAMGSET